MSSVTTYDLSELYKLAFGYNRPPYPILVAQSKTFGVGHIGTVKAFQGQFKASSILGNEYTMPVGLDGYRIPQEPAVAISGGKNVIETQLNRGARKQNVLEEVNLNNYQLDIRGLIINEDGLDEYPEEAVRRLKEICEKPGAITITNALTSIWGIDKIQILNFRFFEVRGNAAVQAFHIEGLSDQDFDLELIDGAERI